MKKNITLKILGLSFAAILIIISLIFAPMLFGTRALTEAELEISESIFGRSIQYEKVKIKEGGLLTWIYPGVTIGHTISFPKNAYDEDSIDDQALLLHEMTHVWQFENIGIQYIPHSLFEEIFETNPYSINYDSNKTFIQYDFEEQAEIIAEYFLTGDSKYEEYIESLDWYGLRSIEGSGQYYTDGTHVYYRKEKMRNADLGSFQNFYRSYAKDKNHVYRFSSIIEEADPNSIEGVGNNYIKDNNNVFYGTKLIEEADPDTFEVLICEGGSKGPAETEYAKDKNQAYKRGYLYDELLDLESFSFEEISCLELP